MVKEQLKLANEKANLKILELQKQLSEENAKCRATEQTLEKMKQVRGYFFLVR